MVRQKIWDYFASLSFCLSTFSILGIFGTVIQWRPHDKDVLSEFIEHAVVFPRISHAHQHITSTQTKNGHLGAITLTLQTANVSLTVDLKLNTNLFSSSYIEKHFADDGTPVLINATNHHLSHCYYHGQVKDDPYSTAAISTCHGIRGTIVSSYGTYHIEPADSSITGQHYVFNSIHQKPKNLTCGHNHQIFTGFSYRKKPSRLKRSAIKDWPYNSNSKTRIVEMYVINDKTEYEKYDRDLNQVLTRTKDLVNIVSSLYTAVNIYIALVGIEVWTDKDKIDVVENPDNTMNNFLTYRRMHISQPNDNAQLITGKQLGSGVVGKAPIKTICSWQYSGGVNNDHNLVVGPVATTVAHELGHNFGLSHDTDKCRCPDDRCIMAASSGGINNPTKWSECSKQEFEDVFEQGMDYCLRNLPEAISGPPVCGNGFLEEGEQCDCGLSQDCNTSCCDPFTCKLTENATCATGACCDLELCKPKKAASVCRPAANECDLPETCNGKDEFCPSDYYHADGKPCTTEYGSSYCYKGKCQTHEGQCQLLWGHTGHRSNDGCYKHFNTMGQPSGHCGFDWVKTEFTPCKPEDVMCGMLHCTHRNEKLMFWKEALAYTMPEGFITVNENNQQVRYDCKGAILDVGLYMPDPGMVPDGATCGENKICVSQHCVPLSELDVKACPDCHGHGVCNNVGECHCDRGYGPPSCDQPGNGGSISGGPTEINNNNIPLVLGLCIFFLIILPLLVVAGYYGYKHRDHLKDFLILGPAEGYRSIYRAQPANDIVSRGDRQPASVISKPVARHASNTSAASVHSHSGNSGHHRSKVKRAASFRPEDISGPQLESSTKSLTGIPSLRHSVCGPPAHTPSGQPPVPSRPAPPRPSSGESAGLPPSRPPPPRGGTIDAARRAPSHRARPPPPTPVEDGPDVAEQPRGPGDGGATELTGVAVEFPASAADRTGGAQYNAKWTSGQDGRRPNRDGPQLDRTPSSVRNARQLFEQTATKDDGRPDAGPRTKYAVGHQPAEPRTNSTTASTRTNQSEDRMRLGKESKSSGSRDARPAPPTTTRPKPDASKPTISKKPSISAPKPPPNTKPEGLKVHLANANSKNADSIC